MTIQVTAKDLNTKFIDSKKSGDVVSQSARFHPDIYMCMGRPDFQQLAKEQAYHIAMDLNFKLMPIFVFVELFVRVKEGKATAEDVTGFIRDSLGYLTVSTIDKYLAAPRM